MRGEGILMPAIFLVLLIFLLVRPGFLIFSTRGSAAQHAPVLVSLGVGLLLGGVAQRSRFCITGSLRDGMLMGGRSYMLWGFAGFLLTAIAFNALNGRFNLGFYGKPGAHLEHLWSFLGMLLVGWVSIIIGGCPFRQLVKAGEGDTDAGLVVAGMFIGGALVQAWGIAATAAGVSFSAKVAILAGLIVASAGCLVLKSCRTE
jgi:YedE family putative selenium metabolism protein